MNYIITVDGGTSNTRTYLWTANGQILTQRSQAVSYTHLTLPTILRV